MARRIQKKVFIFGVILVVAMFVLAIAIPNPTPFQITFFRIILSLAVAGVATMIPGFIELSLSGRIRAGGALAIFVLVYLINPASFVMYNVEPGRSINLQQQIGSGNIQAGRDINFFHFHIPENIVKPSPLGLPEFDSNYKIARSCLFR